tara:strand:+ start:261 stop:788 length:528 start_codon:yes stop_codon:yes gene_type:complete
MATYKPNVEGAINALVDLMTANAFTMTRKPYALNYRGLVDALIDLKEGFPVFAPTRVGFDATAFEAVSNGDALYMRTSDGQVGKATAANGSAEAASVVGFADSAVSSSATVKVIVMGIKTLSGLDAGDLYYLSPSTAGAITTTAPSSSGQSVTRLGEAATTADFSIQIEPPILLV